MFKESVCECMCVCVCVCVCVIMYVLSWRWWLEGVRFRSICFLLYDL